MVKGVDGKNGDPHQAEERGEQREAPAHWLEQVIEEERHSDIARDHDEIGGQAETVLRLVRHDVGRCRRSVIVRGKCIANEGFGEHAHDDGDQVQGAGYSGPPAWRYFNSTVRRFGSLANVASSATPNARHQARRASTSGVCSARAPAPADACMP